MAHFVRGIAGALAHARPGLVGIALALHATGLVITGERWRVVVGALGGRVSLGRAVLVNLAGIFIRNATPTTGLGGDAGRIALLRAEGVPLPQATAAFAYVRLAEVPPLTLLVLLSTPVAAGFMSRSRTVALVAAGTVAGAALVVWIRRAAFERGLQKVWQRTQRVRVGARAMTAALGYATLAQIETIARQIVVAAACGLPLTVQQAATVTVMGIVGGFVPTVGSVGAIDGGLAAGLMLCGATLETAVAITVIERAISYGLSTAAGAGALTFLGGRGLLRAAEERRTHTVTVS